MVVERVIAWSKLERLAAIRQNNHRPKELALPLG